MRAEAVLNAARSRGLMIATAESCTGGMIAAALTDIPGSSDVFERGFVTYSNDAKMELLGVDPALITAHGAVSEQVARAMADGALTRSRAGIALSVTGVAGPGGSEAKPEGMVCFGLTMDVTSGVHWQVEMLNFGSLGRAGVRQASVAHGLAMLEAALTG